MLVHGRRSISIRLVRRSLVLAATSVSTLPVLVPPLTQTALAQTAGGGYERTDTASLILVASLLGAVIFAVLSSIQLIRARNRVESDNAHLRARVGDFQAATDHYEALLDEDDQRLVVWGSREDAPVVFGDLPSEAATPQDREMFLAFGRWLRPDSAAKLTHLSDRLRERGEQFQAVVTTLHGRLLEVRGRTVGGSAVARFRDLTGERLARAEIEARHDVLAAEVETTRAMLAAVPMPIWLRDDSGALVWVNHAYAAAVEAKDDADAVAHGLELLDTQSRELIAASHAGDPVFARRLPVIVAGARRIFDVANVRSEGGSAGIAVDVTEVEAAQATLRREVAFNARTLDQLQAAVAIFGPDRRLKSYNAAYRALFELDTAFLESGPEETVVLDRLRAARKLPEQADFRSWRNDLFSAYQSTDAREQLWHLPDGQTLRVIANPHPQGGATWIYENVTERLDLESRYNALVSVQGETLDHLSEGVAVFGSNGRLRLHNPAFQRIFDLDEGLLGTIPHVAAIVSACRRPGDEEAMWRQFTASVAGLEETRASISGRMERQDGRVIDYATVPLPDGQTMVTFVDVTDTIKVERALVERNEALEAAGTLKNAFIHHVSYELRSPLTNIIGFAQLLADQAVGPLNPKQLEYTGYITQSSASLLAIVNDILDLTTIDAGIMGLDMSETDIAASVAAAVDAVADRADDLGVLVETQIAPGIGTFVADDKRVRQILYNLLSNAVTYSPRGSLVTLTADRAGGFIEFIVEDHGAGIPAGFVDSVFERFSAMPRGSVRGGVGLGLAIVKSFVGLHGGTVELASEEGLGTVARVRLPVRPALDAAAAE